MRKALFYNPRLLMERLAIELNERRRLRRLKRTPAHWLTKDHIDSMELIDLAAGEGAKTIYDIGANVGTWTLLCKALAPNANIYAFEPMPKHIDGFHANTRALSDVRLFPFALGSQAGSLNFYPTSFSDASSFLPLSTIGKKQWKIENEAPVTMNIVPLDDVVSRENLPTPDLIKLDVQGFELEVLRGGVQAIRDARWVLSEVSFQPYYERQVLFSELAAFLAEHGYEVHAFGHSVRPDVPLVQLDVLFRKLEDSPTPMRRQLQPASEESGDDSR